MKIDLSKQPFYLSEEQIVWVEETKKNLTIEQKVGQLFICMGQDYDLQELMNMVTESRVGGILFRPAPASTIKEWYDVVEKDAPVPLLKAANLEEGGSGGISDGTLFGWPLLVSAANDIHETEKFAQVCAYEGRRAGINWTYSPVADIDNNFLNPITNVRSYGSEVQRVMDNTGAYVETIQKSGMAACTKHFPGDGVDFRDHHLHPTYNSLSAQEWYETYGAVYKNLIAKDLLSVMVGHIVQPNVAMDMNPKLHFEDCLPASLSTELLQGVLREKFNFQGLITTDATIMGGYCMPMERKKALPTSIMAGCDMVVFSTDINEDYNYMLQAIKEGFLTETRLNEAVTRILALKAKVCNTPENQKMALEVKNKAKLWHRECADKAITLVKERRKDILPISKEKYKVVRLITLGKDDILDGSMTELATEFLEKQGFEVEKYCPMEDDLHGTGKLQENRITVYLANYEQASNQTTVRIQWCPKHALDIPRFVQEEDSLFISFGNPYLLMDIPRVPVYINAYTATKDTIELALEKIMGNSEFKGVSPVDAFCGLPDTRL